MKYDEEKLKEVKRILAGRGIRMDVSGCGCCGSPSMRVEIDGEMLWDDWMDDANLDMLED